MELSDAMAEPPDRAPTDPEELPLDDEPVPGPDEVEPADEDEADEDPIAAGTLAYPDATPQQQEAARAGLQDRITAYLEAARARVIITDHLRTMLTIKRGDGGVLTFRVHHMFTRAPARVVRAMARYAQTHDREAARLLHAYTDEHEALIRKPEATRSTTLDTEGRYHNLQEIFDALNERYFEGKIEARITWGRRTKRKASRASIGLGQYVFEDKLIRIHPVLDAEDVPRYYVEATVFHEMLHELYGPESVDGRRVHHPPEFERHERQFEHYVAAMVWQHENAEKLLDR